MSYNGPRVPLNFQNPNISKASKKNPSYESFKDNEDHPVNYKKMDDRPSTHAMSKIRRHPDGKLDFEATTKVIVDAIKKAEYGVHNLTPVEEALLTVVFPIKFAISEPQQAEIRTQLSRSEKAWLKDHIENNFKEELAWAAGRGSGSTEKRSRNLNGVG